MSENSSITVDQPQRRNDDQPGQNGAGRGLLVGRVAIPANMRPLVPPTARRTLIIPNQCDIVSVLSSLSTNIRQASYILSGRGRVSRANLLTLPSRRSLLGTGRGTILYLSGWFQPMIINAGVGIPSSRPNGILHVSIAGAQQNVAIANNLIAFGPVEVDVMFVCGPGSVIRPDPPGVLREPIRVRVNAVPPAPVPAPQAPEAE